MSRTAFALHVYSRSYCARLLCQRAPPVHGAGSIAHLVHHFRVALGMSALGFSALAPKDLELFAKTRARTAGGRGTV